MRNVKFMHELTNFVDIKKKKTSGLVKERYSRVPIMLRNKVVSWKGCESNFDSLIEANMVRRLG